MKTAMVNSPSILILLTLLMETASLVHTCPTSEGYLYDASSNLCVKLMPDWITWEQSKEICHAQGDRLVQLNTSAKNDFFKSVIAPDQFWIGVSSDGAGKWYWMDGGQIEQGFWFPDQPDGTGQCVVLGDWFNFMWDDAPCGNSARAACEREVTAGTTTEAITTTTASPPNQHGPSNVTVSPNITHQSVSTLDELVSPQTDTVADTWISPSPTISSLTSTPPSQDVIYTTKLNLSPSPQLNNDVSSDAVSSSIGVSVPVSSWVDTEVFPSTSAMESSTNIEDTSVLYPTPTSLVALTDTSNPVTNTHSFHQSLPGSSSYSDSVSVRDVFDLSTALVLGSSDSSYSVEASTSVQPTAVSAASSNTCSCHCQGFISLTTDELTLLQIEIRRRLLLDTKSLTKTLAKYNSAPDNRKSSVSIGTAGIAILVVFVLLIMVGDLEHVVRLIAKKSKPF